MPFGEEEDHTVGWIVLKPLKASRPQSRPPRITWARR